MAPFLSKPIFEQVPKRLSHTLHLTLTSTPFPAQRNSLATPASASNLHRRGLCPGQRAVDAAAADAGTAAVTLVVAVAVIT